MSDYLYFDIETVPDESRFSVSIPMPAVDQSPPFPAADAPAKPVDEIKRAIGGRLFPSAWVAEAIAVEAAAKNRATAIAELRKADPSAAEQLAEADAAERIKLGSTTPEFCRIVSIAVARDDFDAHSLPGVEGDHEDPYSEVKLIEEFWGQAANAKKLVGFNCLAFDLPVIFVRTKILGVAHPKLDLDLRPWGSRNVVDLYTARFGSRVIATKDRPSSLKRLCRCYGIIQEQEQELDGNSVYPMFKAGKLDMVEEYNRQDVELTRALHNFYAGLFC